MRVPTPVTLGLLTLLGMGGLDATKLSFKIPAKERDRTVDLLRSVDQALFKVPGVSQLGLNLALRAIRA